MALGKTKLPKWAQEDSRTQGGEWIWFPGKYVAFDRNVAASMAVGRALDYLISECGVAHKETKFIEKWERQNKDLSWSVYLRAAIKADHCNEGKYASLKKKRSLTNTNLHQKYYAYKMFLSNKDMDTALCNKDDVAGCLVMADAAWRVKDFIKAAVYAKKGCDLGDSYTCGFYGTILWDLGRLGEAKAYYTKACNAGIERDCADIVILNKQLQKYAATH